MRLFYLIFGLLLFCQTPSKAVGNWELKRELKKKERSEKINHKENWRTKLSNLHLQKSKLKKYRKDKKGKLILRLAWLSILVALSTIFFPIHIGSFLLTAVIISITSNIWARIERANGNDSWRIQSAINVSSLVLWGFVLFLFLLTLLILSFANQEP